MFTGMLDALGKSGDHQPALGFMQRAMGLSDTEFVSLQGIARATTQQSESAKSDALAALCRDEAFTGLYRDSGNLQAISRQLAALDSELDDSREQFFETRVSADLGPAASASVEEWIDANLKPVLKITEFDTEEMALSARTSPGDVFLDNCRNASTNMDRQTITVSNQSEEDRK
jgi:hypothetical protein